MMTKSLLCGVALTAALSQSALAGFPLEVGQFDFCFEPYDNCEEKLVDFINSAQERIDIAIYELDDRAVFKAIKAKFKENKIEIRLVVDSEKASGKKSLVSELADMGVKIRFGKQKGHMHNKFTIVDRKTVQLGSSNYAEHSFSRNQENMTYSSHPELVSQYVDYYQKLWKSSDPYSAK